MKQEDIEILEEIEVLEEEKEIVEKKQKREETKKKIKRKISFKKNIKLIVLSIIVIVCILIAAFIIFNHYKNLNKVDIEKYELYQYFSGIRYEYKGELTLRKNGEITKLKYKDIEIEVDSTPIYFKNIDNEMLIPQNMGFYTPRLMNKNYKLPYFSILTIEKNENDTNAFLKYRGEKKFLEKSFLYDGRDLYIFLYKTKVIIDEEEIILSPLSYITVSYQDEIFYYNKDKDEARTIETHNQDVIANIDGYKINLSTDMIIYDNNSKLLIKNIDNMKTYTDEKK